MQSVVELQLYVYMEIGKENECLVISCLIVFENVSCMCLVPREVFPCLIVKDRSSRSHEQVIVGRRERDKKDDEGGQLLASLVSVTSNGVRATRPIQLYIGELYAVVFHSDYSLLSLHG